MILAKVDTNELVKSFSKLEREQLPFITTQAVNRTASLVREELKAQIPRSFNAPVPLTQGAVFLTKAANKRGPFERDVYLRDEAPKGTPPVKYLAHGVRGGKRPKKPFERALINAGLMTESEMAVPGGGVKLNAYGNIPQATIVRMLTQLKASRDDSGIGLGNRKGGRRKAGAGRYFYSRGPDGNRQTLKRGVYATKGQYRVTPILNFVPQAQYKARFPFSAIAKRVYAREFREQFRIAATLALGRGV